MNPYLQAPKRAVNVFNKRRNNLLIFVLLLVILSVVLLLKKSELDETIDGMRFCPEQMDLGKVRWLQSIKECDQEEQDQLRECQSLRGCQKCPENARCPHTKLKCNEGYKRQLDDKRAICVLNEDVKYDTN